MHYLRAVHPPDLVLFGAVFELELHHVCVHPLDVGGLGACKLLAEPLQDLIGEQLEVVNGGAFSWLATAALENGQEVLAEL